MSSSSSEYLRRKIQALPRTYGPSIYGDASQRTAVLRYRNSKNPVPTLTTSTTPSCCKTLHWHSSEVRVPSGGPYNGRNGDGQQQEWSTDGLRDSRVCCAPLSGTITVPGCCSPDRVAGITYDAEGVPMTAAYQGGRLPCCGIQATLSTIPGPDCSCAVDPATRVDTTTANNMPIAEIPVPPAMKPCCVQPEPVIIPNPCCDEDGFLIPT